jgi:hypothetical protein
VPTRRFAIGILLLALGACTRVIDGKEFTYGPRYRNQIVKGHWHKSDVAKLLGEPWRRDNEDQAWIYYFKEASVDSDRERTLEIDFDGDVVEDVRYKFHENNPFARGHSG